MTIKRLWDLYGLNKKFNTEVLEDQIRFILEEQEKRTQKKIAEAKKKI